MAYSGSGTQPTGSPAVRPVGSKAAHAAAGGTCNVRGWLKPFARVFPVGFSNLPHQGGPSWAAILRAAAQAATGRGSEGNPSFLCR